MTEDLTICDFIFGVKEVLPEYLIPGKHYFFFAHIGKGQAYHKHYTLQLLSKNISLTDYEYLVDENHKRIAAFGKWAGMLGLYYALMAFGKKYQSFNLKSPLEFNNHLELIHALRAVSFPKVKIALTGNGNAAQGTLQLLKELGIKKIDANQFLKTNTDPVFTQLHSQHYIKRKDLNPYEKNHFYQHPEEYSSDFSKYLEACDLFIPCHYWNPSSPCFFTINDLQTMVSFPSIIADVSCDLNGPIPTTIRATTHQDPFYDYNVSLNCEEKAFSNKKNITVMSIDNLPAALPKESSEHFSNRICKRVLSELTTIGKSEMIKNATIIDKGSLTNPFVYLKK